MIHRQGSLIVAGCKSNQSKFYPRIADRTGNKYGKRPDARDQILENLALVEPLLRATATVEIDASAPLAEVVQTLEELAVGSRPPRTPGCGV